MTVEEFAGQARAWLADNAAPRRGMAPGRKELVWGEGELDVAVFHALGFDEERQLIDRARAWQHKKAERGYHAVTWPERYGGLGLTRAHERAFKRVEAEFETPDGHEVLAVTVGLVAPTIDAHGTVAQQEQFVASLLRNDILCCQLFSEPGAGSDLAGLSCRAERQRRERSSARAGARAAPIAENDGGEWVVNGQKVWSSGAQFADYGELICRTDPTVGKHAGLSALIVPMDAPGVEVRPIRQMSGGSSFNEVFLTDVRVSDSLRLGDVGDGWKVALTTLGFERGSAGGGGLTVGGSWPQVLALSRALGLTADPLARQRLADLFIHYRLVSLNTQRATARLRSGEAPGPEGSIGKLFWTQAMTKMSSVVASLLGPRLTADTGEWGTFVWNEHLLGAPGYRIAGGSDEIQRNIIGERVLGLPRQPP